VAIETSPRRVLIADDHPRYCDATRAVVPQACPHALISEAVSQDEVLAAIATEDHFDLVLLDLNLPGASGSSCLRAVRALAPLTPIVIVSAIDDPRIMRDVVIDGASAFVPKSAPGLVLINALRVILAGGTYVPSGLVTSLRAPVPSLVRTDLTMRQQRVLELLATGLSNKQIARALDISEITVKAHVSAIFRKLGVANRVQAGIEARRRLSADH
jgi:DNA-binding NarL/FixJ family response regulator